MRDEKQRPAPLAGLKEFLQGQADEGRVVQVNQQHRRNQPARLQLMEPAPKPEPIPMFLDVQEAGRFEVTVWFDDGIHLANVLDTEARPNDRKKSRDVEIYQQRPWLMECRVKSETKRHLVTMHDDGHLTCNCQACPTHQCYCCRAIAAWLKKQGRLKRAA